jgi:hypothetical protein
MIMRNITLSALVCLIISLMGCTMHTKNSDYHFGPVFFRYQGPDKGKAYVCQTVSFPLWLEGGSQFSLGAGLKEKTVILPMSDGEGSSEDLATKKLNVSKPLSIFGDPKPGQWNLSLLCLRTDYASKDKFLANKIYGTRICGGKELYAFTAGISKTTLIKPSENSIYELHYKSSNPMDTVFKIWNYNNLSELTLDNFKKEEQ